MAGKRLKSDEDGMVIACPQCERAGEVRERTAENTHADDPDKPLYCDTCQTAIDDYDERPAKKTGGDGGPAKYADVTLDDVEISGGQSEPVTDGHGGGRLVQ